MPRNTRTRNKQNSNNNSGNRNTTTRLRRYVGQVGVRPLLPQHDRSDAPAMLRPNVWTSITLTADGQHITVQRDGQTIIPVRLYLNEAGKAKIEIAMAKGKKLHDKRQASADRDWQRDKARLMRDKG